MHQMVGLEQAFSSIKKSYGEGSISRLGDKPLEEIQIIPSGSFQINKALGVGGFPLGRIVEMFGTESSGKTTVALHACAEAHKLGMEAAFIDVEHAFDPTYAARIGVNVDRLIFSQPSSAEEALEICSALVESNEVSLIIIDSVAALVPRAEVEGEMGDSHMGLKARLMSQALRKLTATASKSNTCIIFINQIREKIGVMFGSNETTPGGRALKFHSSVRLDVRRRGQLKSGTDIIGNDVFVKVVKNKVAPPFRTAEIIINYGEGIDIYKSYLDAGVELGIIAKKGAHWYDWDGERFAGSAADASAYLKNNSEFHQELIKKVDDSDI